jgi:N-carbamoyl-L-amino-acid hydrolase
LTGSHLDSQPVGGRYDGTYGVLAGIETILAMKQEGHQPRRSIEVVVWTNEEGARFQPGAMGSRAFARPQLLPSLLGARDSSNKTVSECLGAWRSRFGDRPSRPLGSPVKAYVEAHIEQGPILEDAGHIIGVVTAVQGMRRYAVEIIGQEGHAGTTPSIARRDALRDAVRICSKLYELAERHSDRLRFTIGQLQVSPGGISVVPGKVRFTIDLRHPEEGCLDSFREDTVRVLHHGYRCECGIEETSRSESVDFDRTVTDVIERVARHLGFPTARLPSGAGHDAMWLARVCPSGMIFIPCRDGLSHNAAEYAAPAHMVAGTEVLAALIKELADE